MTVWQSSSEYRFMTALFQVLCNISEEFLSSIFDPVIILCALWAMNCDCELHSMGELRPQWEEHILRVVTSTDNWKLQPTERRLVIECLLKTSENITMKTHAYLFAWRLNLCFLLWFPWNTMTGDCWWRFTLTLHHHIAWEPLRRRTTLFFWVPFQFPSDYYTKKMKLKRNGMLLWLPWIRWLNTRPFSSAWR